MMGVTWISALRTTGRREAVSSGAVQLPNDTVDITTFSDDDDEASPSAAAMLLPDEQTEQEKTRSY
jgi:Flp pilus assembly protein CpaB